MRSVIALCLVVFFALPVAADAPSANGVWKTEANDKGGYLEVTLAPCASDAKLTCGTISKAISKAGVDAAYPNLGKAMVEGMKHDGQGGYSGGTIWDPVNGKTFKGKMTLHGDELDVDGCVSFLCQGQHWQRVTQ